jgi:hypothetical protein
MRVVHAGAALVVAVEEKRMSDPMFWPAVAAAAWGLTCYAVFYGAAALIEHRQNRRRRAHLRNRLHG